MSGLSDRKPWVRVRVHSCYLFAQSRHLLPLAVYTYSAKVRCSSSKAVWGCWSPPGLSGPWWDSTPINSYPHIFTHTHTHTIIHNKIYAFTHWCTNIHMHIESNTQIAAVQISTSMHQWIWKAGCWCGSSVHWHWHSICPSIGLSICPLIYMSVPKRNAMASLPELSWQTNHASLDSNTLLLLL